MKTDINSDVPFRYDLHDPVIQGEGFRLVGVVVVDIFGFLNSGYQETNLHTLKASCCACSL